MRDGPVRLAIPSDEPSLLALLHLMHEENGMAPLDKQKVMGVLRRGIDRQRSLVGVIREHNVVVGSVGLFVEELWYSTQQHVEDFWNFVHPDYRKSTHAKHLLEFSKSAAQQLGKPLLMEVMANERTAAKVKLYERQLGTARGALFIAEPAAA